MNEIKNRLTQLLNEYYALGINRQIDHDKFYLYSLVTHSTAIEGSTVTEIENQLLFDEGISAKGRPMVEQLMNLDLKTAYELSKSLASEHTPFVVNMLKQLSAVVMKNTGSEYNTPLGQFNSANGDLRLLNVTAGVGGKSYMDYAKVPSQLEKFCKIVNDRRTILLKSEDCIEKYLFSFDAHYLLVTIHPWADGNGRMSRLIMNHLQFEFGLIPTKVNKENKANYIQALIDSREQESFEPFRLFMLREHISNLKAEIENYKKSNKFDLINANSDLINKEIDPIKVRLLEEIKRDGTRNYEEFSSILGVSEATIKRRLNNLKAEGIIERIGSNKKGYWRIIE